MLLIDLVNSLVAPLVVSAYYAWFRVNDVQDKTLGSLLDLLPFFCLAQVVLLFLSIFTTRVSEDRSQTYIKYMPEAVYYMSLISLTILPVIIIVLMFAAYLDIVLSNGEFDTEILPMIAFTFFVQAIILISYFFSYRNLLLADLTYWQN